MKAFLAFLVVFVLVVSCGACGIGIFVWIWQQSNSNQIVGKWSSQTAGIEIRMDFSKDGTLDSYFKSPVINQSMSGTYRIEGDILETDLPQRGKNRSKFEIRNNELIIHSGGMAGPGGQGGQLKLKRLLN